MKALVTAILGFIITLSVAGIAVAQYPTDSKEARRTAEMKARIQKLGTGSNAHIKIELGDGTRLSGHISEIKDKSFVLVSDQSGAATEIEYADARKPGRKLSRGASIAIGVGIALGAAVLLGSILTRVRGY
jgi:hypothetical protein